MYNSDSQNTKFIPVVFADEDLSNIPTPLQGATYYNVSIKSGYEKLYWRLRGVAGKSKPELGKLRPLPEKERKTLLISSMIDIEIWDKAAWQAAGFIVSKELTELPILLLIYNNEEFALKIFKDWIAIIGRNDINDDIRVAFIEGDVPGDDKGYYVVIGNNLDEELKRAKTRGIDIDEMMILNVSRYTRCYPKDDFYHYNLFKQEYLKKRNFYLIPAAVDKSLNQVKPLFDCAIMKHKIEYRNLKDIAENDIDSVVFTQDKPFTPFKSE